MGAAGSSLAGLTPEEVIFKIAEYFHARNVTVKDAFRWLDSDCSGFITWEEFLRGVQLCVDGMGGPQAINPLSLFPVFTRFDVDGDGKMSIQEFAAAFGPTSAFAHTWENVDAHAHAGGALPPLPAPGACDAAAVPRVERQQGRLAQEVVDRLASSLVRTGHTPQELFARLDRDRNGRLSRPELEQVILSLQPDLTLTEREAVYERFDRDGGGTVDLYEFQEALQAVNAPVLVAIEDKVKFIRATFSAQGYTLHQSFSVFDRNSDGYLSREEWTRAMTALGLTATLGPSDVEAVFSRFDTNGDGYMSISEFQQFFEDTIDRSPAVLVLGAWPVYEPPPVEAVWETELLDLVRTCLSVGRSGMSITEVWRRLDVDKSNSMSFFEFSRVVNTYRADLTEEALASLFYKVNTSKSGAISMSEFIRRFG